MHIHLEDLWRYYLSDPEQQWVLKGVNLSIEPCGFLGLLGPNGCGKSTLLRVIAGREHGVLDGRGTVEFKGENALDRTTRERGVVYLRQEAPIVDSLVRKHLALRPRSLRFSRKIIEERVEETLRRFNISELRDEYTATLSGGRKKLTALAGLFAGVENPSVVLLDEPCSDLDTKRKRDLQEIIEKMRGESTVVYSSHDQQELMRMCRRPGDRVAVFQDGKIGQIGTPTELIDSPASWEIATLVGEHPINRLDPQEGALLALSPPPTTSLIGVRPKDIHLGRTGRITGQVIEVNRFGERAEIRVSLGGRGTLLAIESNECSFSRNDRVGIKIGRAHYFRPDGTRVSSS